MKKLFVILMPILVLCSCAKDDNLDVHQQSFAALQGRYLVCKSIQTTMNGRTTTQIIGKGKGYDLIFGIYGNLEVYANPTVYKNYVFQTPDKIYYWENSEQNKKLYTVQSMTENSIVLVDADDATGKVMTEFFSVE